MTSTIYTALFDAIHSAIESAYYDDTTTIHDYAHAATTAAMKVLGHENINDWDLIALSPQLARRVIAAEKLVDALAFYATGNTFVAKIDYDADFTVAPILQDKGKTARNAITEYEATQ